MFFHLGWATTALCDITQGISQQSGLLCTFGNFLTVVSSPEHFTSYDNVSRRNQSLLWVHWYYFRRDYVTHRWAQRFVSDIQTEDNCSLVEVSPDQHNTISLWPCWSLNKFDLPSSAAVPAPVFVARLHNESHLLFLCLPIKGLWGITLVIYKASSGGLRMTNSCCGKH